MYKQRQIVSVHRVYVPDVTFQKLFTKLMHIAHFQLILPPVGGGIFGAKFFTEHYTVYFEFV